MSNEHGKFSSFDKAIIIVLIGSLLMMAILSNNKQDAFSTSLQLNSIADVIDADYKAQDSFDGLHMQGISQTGILMDSDNPYNNRFDHPEGGSLFIDVIDYKSTADAVMITLMSYPAKICAPLISATKDKFDDIYIGKTKVKTPGNPVSLSEINDICLASADEETRKVNIRFILEKFQQPDLRPHIINAGI